MSIRYVRMSDGEELLAEFDETQEHYVLTNPLQIDYGEVDETRYAFLSRWNAFSLTSSIIIPKSHVFYHTEIHEEAVAYYTASLVYSSRVSDPIFKKRLVKAETMISDWSEPTNSGDITEMEADGLNPTENTTFH